MLVYIVMECEPYEGGMPLHVFKDKAKAEALAEAKRKQDQKANGGYYIYRVMERMLQ